MGNEIEFDEETLAGLMGAMNVEQSRVPASLTSLSDTGVTAGYLAGDAQVPVLRINGQLPGSPEEIIWSIPLGQLQVQGALSLRSAYYREEEDLALRSLAESIKMTGKKNVFPLFAIISDETHPVRDPSTGNIIELPYFDVVIGRRRLSALRIAGATHARVIIPTDKQQAEDLLLWAAADERLRKQLCLLDYCDSILRLRDKGFGQEEIATHYRIDQADVSRYERAAKEPEQIRAYLASETGELAIGHLKALWNRSLPPSLHLLVARYTVQERLSIASMQAIMKGIAPLSGNPTQRLIAPAEVDGRVALEQLDGTIKLSQDHRPEIPEEYNAPGALVATKPQTILRTVQSIQSRARKFGGYFVAGAPKPSVNGQVLAITQLLDEYRSTNLVIPVDKLEAALVADREALRQASGQAAEEGGNTESRVS